ncbi:CTP--2,3-di-O-geranylgeranyl-sn-glycero-1-phosphate cytidyltransferase [archaeon]|nr:CTP--2,3-di-O-geranylgeranyl-sn-glycero-1-phosphate cytidyltransferase [archaeon]
MNGRVRGEIKKRISNLNIKRKELKTKLKTKIKTRIARIKDSEWDFNRELGRKLIHLLSIVYILLYLIISNYFGHKAGLLALSGLLIVLLEIEYVRIELKAKLPILSYLWKHFKRRSEHQRVGGEVFFILGAIIVYSVFDVRVATTAILMTTFGDLSAALVGKHLHKIWIFEKKRKALEGALAEFFVNLFVGFLFLRTLTNGSIWWLTGLTITGAPIWIAIFAMALIATVVETCVSKIDDNLLIPLFAGFTGHLVLVLLSYSML